MKPALPLLCLLCAFAPLREVQAAAPSKPNIVFILADDLGYGDLACYGGKDIKTPQIDSLARDGRKFTSFYVHQRCPPSRLAFMTGCYAHRVGTTKVIYPRDRMGIHPDERTTPELLKEAGYTCGLVGKWHLGDWEPFHPLNHGFDFKGAWHVGADGGGVGEEGGVFMENRTVLSETYRTGKSHLATALGMAACAQGRRVRFFRVTELVTLLLEAKEERQLLRLRQQLGKLGLLFLDELGYVPASKAGAELLFDVIATAYERNSLIVTTNLPFENWTEVLGSERLTGAALDRLTHRCHILETKGESYRLQDAKRRRRRTG